MTKEIKFQKYRDISPKTMLELYKEMLYIRLVSEALRAAALRLELKCPVHFSFGQEATAAGVGLNLLKQDAIVTTHRSHAPYLAKGGSLNEMIAEIYNKSGGCVGGIGGSMHLSSPENNIFSSAIVSGAISIATGLALSFQIKRKKNVSVAFFGDGAAEEGALSESLNFASLKKLPVIFFCENNMYAVDSSIKETKAVCEIFRVASAYNVPRVKIDGNNVIEVYKEMGKAVVRARTGKGPTFIEAGTYRWLEHVGPNFDHLSGQRPEKEVKKWISRCPLKLYEEHLLKKYMLEQKTIIKMKVRLNRKIKDAWKYMEKSPYPILRHISKTV